jgi:hypothetical protein
VLPTPNTKSPARLYWRRRFADIAPAIVRAASLMPIHGLVTPTTPVHVGFIQRLRLQATEHILKAGWNFERAKFLGLGEMLKAMRDA